MVQVNPETIYDPLFGGQLSSYVIKLYELFSVKPLPTELTIPSHAWEGFINTVYALAKYPRPTLTVDETLISPLDIEPTKPKVLLALSGGKDSTASLLRLKDEGRDVTAYFCKGINQSYQTENKSARNIAEYANVPFVEDWVKKHGKCDFVENPIKNMLILARMIEYGLQNGISIIQLGEYWDTGNSKVNSDYDMSDSIDLIFEFETAVQSHYPHINFDVMFESEATAIAYILTNHKKVLQLINSCLMPTRYFNRQLSMVIDKYPNLVRTESILPNRCMSCWKCCMEYLYISSFLRTPIDKDYTFHKVFPTLIKKMPEIDHDYSLTMDLSKISAEEILEHTIEYSQLLKYRDNPDSILEDIHHRIRY